MNDPVSALSRLDRLRVVAEYQEYQLRRTLETIRVLEVEEERERQRRAAARAQRSWKLQPSRAAGAPEGAAMLHRGNCALWKAEFGYLNATEARVALAEPGIEVCEVCRPENALG